MSTGETNIEYGIELPNGEIKALGFGSLNRVKDILNEANRALAVSGSTEIACVVQREIYTETSAWTSLEEE